MKKRSEIFRGLLRQLLQRYALKHRHILGDVPDHGRLVLFTAMRYRRQIRRIGLYQQAIERDIARSIAKLLRISERHNAGKRDVEPHIQQLTRGLPILSETV